MIIIIEWMQFIKLWSVEIQLFFFDISIGGVHQGRMRIELFKEEAPRCVENFRQFCTGEYRNSRTGIPMGYKGCCFHRVIRGFIIQGGDFVNGDGTGMISIYGTKFADENFSLKHLSSGFLSMANEGKDSNGCQFFITCSKIESLDGKNVVFGKILNDGESNILLRKIENVPTNNEYPILDVIISECGEL